jgi:hypothetical protein
MSGVGGEGFCRADDIGCLELGAPELPVADEPRRATGWIACTSVQGHLKRAVELGVQLL